MLKKHNRVNHYFDNVSYLCCRQIGLIYLPGKILRNFKCFFNWINFEKEDKGSNPTDQPWDRWKDVGRLTTRWNWKNQKGKSQLTVLANGRVKTNKKANIFKGKPPFYRAKQTSSLVCGKLQTKWLYRYQARWGKREKINKEWYRKYMEVAEV